MGAMRALCVLAILGVAHAAPASPVLVSDGRELALSDLAGLGCAVSDVVFLPAAPFAPFDETETLSDPLLGAVTASQSSLVGADAMSGAGAVGNTTGTSHFCARSTFSVTFDLASTHAYEFSGTLTTGDDQAFASFSLSGTGGGGFDHLVSGFDSEGFAEAGVLLPGQYTLSAFVESGAGSGSSFSFDFQLVPEPACWLLLALAAAPLPAQRRQRRASALARGAHASLPREQPDARRHG